MDGGEGPRRLDELDKLVVVADQTVRGCPCLSRLRTGAALSGRTGEANEGKKTAGRTTAGGRGGKDPDRQGKSSR